MSETLIILIVELAAMFLLGTATGYGFSRAPALRPGALQDTKKSVAVAKLVDATHAYSQCIRSSEHAANSKEKFAAFMEAIEEVGKLGDVEEGDKTGHGHTGTGGNGHESDTTTNRGRTFWLARDRGCSQEYTFCLSKLIEKSHSNGPVWCAPKGVEAYENVPFCVQEFIPRKFHLDPAEQIHIRVTPNGWKRID